MVLILLALLCFEGVNSRSERKKGATAMPYPQNAVLYQIVMDATDNEFLFFFTYSLLPAPSYPHQTAKNRKR
jgi:hypothetical protein